MAASNWLTNLYEKTIQLHNDEISNTPKHEKIDIFVILNKYLVTSFDQLQNKNKHKEYFEKFRTMIAYDIMSIIENSKP